MNVVCMRSWAAAKRLHAGPVDAAALAFCLDRGLGAAEALALQGAPGHPLAQELVAWVRGRHAMWSALHGAEGRRPTARGRADFERWLLDGEPLPAKPKASR